MRNFKQYDVWKRSHTLVLRIYTVTRNFPETEKYALISQMKRAAYSIPSNIAEGCGRNSDKDFNRFLQISLDSAHELEYFVHLTYDLNFIDDKIQMELDSEINLIKSMLYNLSQKLKYGEKVQSIKQ